MAIRSAPLRQDIAFRQMESELSPTDTPDINAFSPVPEQPATIAELFPNWAEDEQVVTETKKQLSNIYSTISDRGDLETIWDDNDRMYRVKPDETKDDVHRANEATGVFHISINQLVSMAFKVMTDNPHNYKYGYKGVIDDEIVNTMRAKNAEILTQLLHRAFENGRFKKNLKRLLLNIYKNGTGFLGIPWEKRMVDLTYRDKETGGRKSMKVSDHNLPGFEFIPIDKIRLDENIDEIDDQPGIFIDSPISWSKLLSDSRKNKVKLFARDSEQEDFKNKFAKYKYTVSGNRDNVALSDRADNADRPLQDRTSEQYQHWVIWALLPINKESGKWDINADEIRCRVRILGTPESCEIIEIRENVFPGGIPMLVAHQTEDDIGMYHISLGEKIKSYYDQICIAIDQLIDNRSKNCRRSLFYDPLRITSIDKYDFGHSNAIPVEGGDIRSAVVEMQIADMTQTIMPTINYCEMKIKEIMNTTDAVMGQALGGRTSASEYMGAKASATTPIYSDMASMEDDIIGGYMLKFAQYVHTFMTLEDIVDQVGEVGNEFQFQLADIYSLELRGVVEAMDKTMRIQNLMQLFSMSTAPDARAKIMIRLAEAMEVENPAEMIPIPAKDQAVKAALWENNEMLVHAQWDEPEMGEMHDIHLQIHKPAMWQAQREDPPNPNINFIQEHISKHEMLKKQQEAMSQAGGVSPLPQQTGVDGTGALLPGDVQGEAIAAPMGNIQAGSPVPSEPI